MGFMGLFSDFLVGVFTVVLMDIVLAGDKAVVIAMAAESLPQDKRHLVTIFGAGLAVQSASEMPGKRITYIPASFHICSIIIYDSGNFSSLPMKRKCGICELTYR
jgi:Integral membrane protein TerC family